MKKRRQPSGDNPPLKPPASNRDIVERLARAGLNADAIAQVVGVNKNTLRAQHALALANGRAALKRRKAEERASALTREECCAANAILMAFDGGNKWLFRGKSLLWRGVSGEGAHSAADAFARWQLDGRTFITTGITDRFSPARIREFAELKAEAKKLLQKA
jgi:hypothetical protein